ncbi:MAG TPA: hypothetical protein VKU61_14340 [Candidatus Binatia bacterium]|nr:hypothetical protein [Candidatus Binatia bacterium]
MQTWTPMMLLFTVLAVAAATPTMRHRKPTMELPRLFESASPAEYCAVPSPMAGRQLEIAQRVSPRQTAAMLVMMMGQRGRFIGFGR